MEAKIFEFKKPLLCTNYLLKVISQSNNLSFDNRAKDVRQLLGATFKLNYAQN